MSADGEDGASEAANPKLTIDVAVAGGQKTGALAAGEFELSGTDALAVVCVCHCCSGASPSSAGRVGGSDEGLHSRSQDGRKKACSMLFLAERR